jgi:hypothetical protein
MAKKTDNNQEPIEKQLNLIIILKQAELINWELAEI